MLLLQFSVRFGLLTAATCAGSCLEHRELSQSQASECSGCHGNPARPGATAVTEADRLGNILLRAAPPFDVAGNSTSNFRGVGAHLAHVKASPNHPATPCIVCHPGVDTSAVHNSVSIYYFTWGHIDGRTVPAFSAAATSNGTTPTYDTNTLTCTGTWCHGPSAAASAVSPVWTRASAPLDCTSCHGMPPNAPHPQPPVDKCSFCHDAVVGGTDGRTIINSTLHINGEVNVNSQACNGGCHGSSTSAAPPVDLSGNSTTSAPGVGAHQKHLNTTIGRQVQCNDCHVEPSSVSAPGHLDTSPGAEVTFSSLASSGTTGPVWNGTSCANVYCHNPATATQLDTGATLPEPQWTSTGQVVCGSCHGLPPPAPHPVVTGGCDGCHTNTTANFGFVDVSKHINGTVDF